MSISNRERFKAIAHFQRPGDLFTNDMIWPETSENWIKQGAPKELLYKDPDINGVPFHSKYFEFSEKHIITGIKSGWAGGPNPETGHGMAGLSGCPLIPEYENRTIAEDEHTVTAINGAGQTVKIIKDKFAMPLFLDWPVKDWATWKEHKKRLDPNTSERWPVDLNAYIQELNSMDIPIVLQAGSLYGYLRDWIGNERLLYMFYDNPSLIEDIMDQIVYMEVEIIKRIVKKIKIEQAEFSEDMAYKAGPLISPAMVKKFMVPRYKKITELLRSNGIDIIYVDCDGNIDQLIPLWLESGINYTWPLEQAAGNDAVAYRKKYGKELIIGGTIDKRALLKGKEAIKEEVMSKVPFLLNYGGYFPSVDHVVPPDVTFENYCYYLNLLREVAGLEKLSL